MKILAIMGSPKGKGSGYQIVKMIEDRMKALGDVEFGYIFLKNANLKPCTGCYVCLAKGEDKCPLKDDRAALEQQLLAADGILLSSPLYVLNVSGLMKNFIDRFAYANHRPRFQRQKVMTVVNMGGDSPQVALSLLGNALGGSRVVHKLGVATPPWKQTERAVARKERAIAAAAQKFYRACLDTSLPAPTVMSLLFFRLRQAVFIAHGQDLPADVAFYAGKDYYYETAISPITAAVARAIAGVVLKLMPDIGPGSLAWPVAAKDE